MGADLRRFDPNTLTSLTLQNSLFVAKNGNDATGTRNRLDKPFLTITAAQTAASSGDVIIIFPGTYTDTLLQKNGVEYYFYPGAVISAANTIWSMTSDISYTVSGYGEFISTSSVVNIAPTTAGTFNLTCRRMQNSSTFSTITLRKCTAYVTILEDVTQTGNGPGITFGAAGDTALALSVYVNVSKLNTVRTAVQMTGGATAKYFLNIDEINVSSAGAVAGIFALNVIGAGYAELRGKINYDSSASTGAAIQVNNNVAATIATVNIYSELKMISGTKAFTIADSLGGTLCTMYGKISGTGRISVTTAGTGKMTFKNDIDLSFSNGAIASVLDFVSGHCEIACRIKQSSTVIPANDHTITVNGTGLILNDAILVNVNGIANSIFAMGGDQHVNVYSGYMNVDVGGAGFVINDVTGTNLILDTDII